MLPLIAMISLLLNFLRNSSNLQLTDKLSRCRLQLHQALLTQKLHAYFIVVLETSFCLNLRMVIFSQMSLALGYLMFIFEEDTPRPCGGGRMTMNYPRYFTITILA